MKGIAVCCNSIVTPVALKALRTNLKVLFTYLKRGWALHP